MARAPSATNLKTYNKILKRNIEHAKRIYYEHRFNKYKNDAKNTWKVIKKLINRNVAKKQKPCRFKVDDKILTEEHEIANAFNTYFTNIGPSLASNIKTNTDKTFDYFLGRPRALKFTFNQITETDVIKIIDGLPSKNSSGIDDMSPNLLKSIKHEISKPITLIINQCFQKGIFPDKLKIAKVVPIYKCNDETALNNYRPISVLPSLSKVFERVIFNQIHEYFNLHNLYYGNQYGFRKGHSTELAILEVIDRVTLSLDIGDTPINIYLDLSKAFDTLNHDILLQKLNHYGIHGISLDLFRSYLSRRQQYVDYNGTKSKLLNITTGVPQGSILGPLLFIIYINDIAHSSNKFDFIIYADDTTLCSTLNRNTNIDAINTELNNITEWLLINKLSLNVNKTKAMVFHMPQKKIIIPNLQIADTVIEFVDAFKFLGITISKHLTWNNHVMQVTNKIARTIGMMHNLKKILPLNILRILYNSLVLPHLNYGILAWGRQTKQLDIIHKKAIRMLTGSNYNAHTEPLFKKMDLLKVSDICKLQEIKFYYKLVNKQLPIYFDTFNFQANSNLHDHNTRTRQQLHVTRVNHAFATTNLRHNIIQTVNNTPENVIGKVFTHSINGMTTYAKKYLIRNYETTCTITNCYVCKL